MTSGIEPRKRVFEQKKCISLIYDALNRITSATSNDNRYNLSDVTYNKMGGILSLTRTGWQNSSNFTDMDVLTYQYDAGNKPLKITDTGNKAYGFKDGTNTSDDFEYDANGSRIIDRNKGITGITYNHFNLPTQITIASNSDNGNLQYIYDASGVKLRKIVNDAGNITTTDYSGKHIYENGVLKSIQHPEGYTEPENDGTYSYVYQYKDHVENVRLSYSDRDGNGSITTDEILEENSYYPFGGKHAGYNIMIRSTNPALRFKFANKELSQELGLSMYDFGARQMDEWDPTWWQIDPKAELMRRHSPYNYAFNNPIFFLDPDGMMACPNGDCPDLPSNNIAPPPVDSSISGTKATGDAQGAHVETTETGERFYGFKAEGQVKGENGKISGSISGFSAGYDGYTEEGGAHGSASVYGLEGEAGARLGTEDNNVAVDAEGSVFKAEVSGDAGFYTGQNGKYGGELGGEAGAYALEGDVTPSVSIGGINLGFTIGGSLGSAHIGARGAGTVNTQTKEFEATGNFHIGLGAGFKVGISISNTSQSIDKRKK